MIINSIPISTAPRREPLSDISFILPLEESERVTAANLTDEFDQRHLCRVTFPIPKLKHPSVAPWTLQVPRSNLVKQLTQDLTILDFSSRQPARMKIPATS
jgi:hypothetical protein